MISESLKQKFESTIEIRNINWDIVDNVAVSDKNILRPIKGVSFEEYFVKLLKKNFNDVIIKDGIGDSDIDLIVNGHKLQLKTHVAGSTRFGVKVAVALHKTHGDETRPNNLYRIDSSTFDILVVFHPESGIFLVPYEQIPEHETWNGYLADPAMIDWESEWLNKWSLIGIPDCDGKVLDDRIVPSNSLLPLLSKETYLDDFEIVEMLCKPQYFRAAVMGLKGNIKENWFISKMRSLGLTTINPTISYAKYDVIITNNIGETKKIQVKGTSKNMCSIRERKIGFEIMGTHGQFPSRGYRHRDIDYVALIISEDQLPSNYPLAPGLHFLFIPISDLPKHYLINKGITGKLKGIANEKWNLPEYNDVLYPNIKLIYCLENSSVVFNPDIRSYSTRTGIKTIPEDSSFRRSGPFLLDKLPTEFTFSSL